VQQLPDITLNKLVKMAKFHNIEQINPHDLTPYENNHQVHGEKQVKKLAYWIKKIGFPNSMSILYEMKNGDRVILHGHRRRLAAIHLNLETVPTQQVEGLTEEEAIAWRMADNALTLENEWDWKTIQKEFERLKTLDSSSFQEIGFAEKHFQKLKPVLAVSGEWGINTGQSGEEESSEQNEKEEKEAIAPTRMIVATLTSGQFKLWCNFKAKIGEKDDSKALMEAINGC
jgi:hypothetical protein